MATRVGKLPTICKAPAEVGEERAFKFLTNSLNRMTNGVRDEGRRADRTGPEMKVGGLTARGQRRRSKVVGGAKHRTNSRWGFTKVWVSID